MDTTSPTRTTIPTHAPPPTPARSVGSPLPVSFSAALGLVLVAATLFGLLVDGAYPVSEGVREDLPATLRGQDLLTLLTVPVLLWTAAQARAGSAAAHLVWLGLQLYYVYSYVMYAFAPFTDVFLLYVAVMGASGYALVDGLLRIDVGVLAPALRRVPRRAVAAFVLAVAGLFAVLWLSMILPAIPGGLPEGRVTYDIASAVHVLDLAFVLPLLVAAGVMLLRGHLAGPVLAVVLLVKMTTLGAALLAMNLAFVEAPNTGETMTWAVIALVSAGFLTLALRGVRAAGDGWMRPSLWR